MLATAIESFVAAGPITRFANQPINLIVTTWSADAPSADWTRHRDDWWRWTCDDLRAGRAVPANRRRAEACIGRLTLHFSTNHGEYP